MAENALYYGDNLDILRHHVEDESVDLVYLDPPFKSDQDYNVLFAEKDGTAAAAQIQAFEDTWEWNMAAAESFAETVEAGGDVSRALQAFRDFIGENDMLAYLSMMAPRLVEMRRVLNSTGSLYLHCDPTASHYLKLLLDAVFGPQMFRSEVIWKRTSAHGSALRWGPVHDVILFYTKSDSYNWNKIYQPLPQSTIDKWYNNVEEETGRRYNRADLTAPGVRSGSSGEPWRDVDPTDTGRHWAIPRSMTNLVKGLDTQEALDALDKAGRIHWPKTPGGKPMLKRYLEESKGVPASDVITDVSPLKNMTQERLGYPTQKPLELLERIVEASSNEGDVVLDPFCGCGTTIDAAEKLGRRWIGIDVTHLAITLIKHRLRDTYADKVSYEVHGEPASLSGAEQLASEDRFQFEWWALGLVGARPQEQKKGADAGIDGRLYFHDEPGGKTKHIILSVKSGKPKLSELRDLRGVVDREEAQLGVLITLQPPTGPMKKEAASAGFYESPWGKHPRLQVLTIEALLGGGGVDYPPVTGANVTFKRARRAQAEKKGEHQGDLLDG